jgi:hypothetical protein
VGVALVVACNADSSSSSAESSAGPEEESSTTPSSEGADGIDGDSTGSTSGTSNGDDAQTTTSGNDAMICQPICEAPSDCCPPPDQLPPGVECPVDFPFNFVCPDGVCRPGGCSSDVDCEYFQGTAPVCLPSNGVGRCVIPCAAETDCDGPPFGDSCDGLGDDGTSFCSPADPNACTGDETCGAMGTCVDGTCRCSDDDDCGRGWGCTPDW